MEDNRARCREEPPPRPLTSLSLPLPIRTHHPASGNGQIEKQKKKKNKKKKKTLEDRDEAAVTGPLSRVVESTIPSQQRLSTAAASSCVDLSLPNTATDGHGKASVARPAVSVDTTRLGSRSRVPAARAWMEHRGRVKAVLRFRAPAPLANLARALPDRPCLDGGRGGASAAVCLGILFPINLVAATEQQRRHRRTLGSQRLFGHHAKAQTQKRLGFSKWTSDNFSFAALRPQPCLSRSHQQQRVRKKRAALAWLAS